ncbi:uncharacterized protein LOC127845431 isoform X2 [Dreissena polymorpha]|uniref:uncharacterized protein LOC127845431 isoform X2 n=1 Tax=Dreissena polymorpha TaxID=45954 RepID=UPI002264F2A5|nr:uncharacterized protein LOC127845431 isoform X2 [Dreissena polymorpha]
MDAFCALTDDIITQILNYPFPKRKELEDLRKTQEPNQQRLEVLREEEQTWSEARSLLEKVLKRKFYKFVAEIKLPRLAKVRGSQSYLKETIVRVFCKEDRHFHLLKEKLDLLTDMMNTLQLSFADTALEQQ